jgi:hypothetical protein
VDAPPAAASRGGCRHPVASPEGDEQILKSLESGTSGCFRFCLLPVVMVKRNGQELHEVKTDDRKIHKVMTIQLVRWNLGLLIISALRKQKLHKNKQLAKTWARALHWFDNKEHVAQDIELAIVARAEIKRKLLDFERRAETNPQPAGPGPLQQLSDNAGRLVFSHIAAYQPPWQSFVSHGLYLDLYQVVRPDKGVSSSDATTPCSIWTPVGCLGPCLERHCAEAMRAWLDQRTVHKWAKKPAKHKNAVRRAAEEYPDGYCPCQPPGFCSQACNCMDDARPQESWELRKRWLEDEPGWGEREEHVSQALRRLVADNEAEYVVLEPSGYEVPWHCRQATSRPGQYYYFREDVSQFEEPEGGRFIQGSPQKRIKTSSHPAARARL